MIHFLDQVTQTRTTTRFRVTYRQWNTRRKADKLALGWSSKEGTLPALPRIKGKLAYSVTVTNPLAESEKYERKIYNRHSDFKTRSAHDRTRD